ncbi:hypothetical protein [Mycetocola zhadangensis]|uniref:Large exoprotein n=1 Tax=Mycetocola zhadangensis TaxID=1164595 RepID=A0A3L7J4N9_9MICO|nr:hypothetical protein [Mycetocola zhadangensis]RLQ85567.1 hypothetical protein D9V28_01390 [Mycetocola zhadangensis]GGE83771.1 hypothetical protein GCM10011313_02750 [Mycetocola zhadangensis]
MAGSGLLSGGIVFAIAAALWIIYLMPTWLRRNEFLATERNAVRLQQTLRILAETAEAPREVHVETTARSVAEQQKILKKYEAEALERARVEALALVEAQKRAEKARQTEEVRRATIAREARLKIQRARRRARLATTLVLTASLVASAFGGWLLATGGSAVLLAIGASTATLSGALLVRMARVTGRTGVAAPAAQAAPVSQVFEPVAFDEVTQVETTWTPTPLPKPLHLSQGSAAAGTIAQADAHAALRRAALAQVMAERAAQLEPQLPTIAPIAPAAQEPSPRRTAQETSRFAGMGVVDEAEIAPANLSSLLQRRRAAG